MLFCQYTFWMFQRPFVWKQIHKSLMSRVGILVKVFGQWHHPDISLGLHRVPYKWPAGTDDRHISRSFVVAAKEVIFSSQSNQLDNIFSQIVIPIPKQAFAFQTFYHVVPSCIDVRNGFSGLEVGTVPDTFGFHPHLHGTYDRSGQFPAFHLHSSYDRPTLSQQCSTLCMGLIMFGHSLFSSRTNSKWR